MGPTATDASPARRGNRLEPGDYPRPRWAPTRPMRALRGESGFSFYPRGVCSPAEIFSRVAPRSSKRLSAGRSKGKIGVGGTWSGGSLFRSSGLAAGALGSGGDYRRAESGCPGAVGSRRARWARGARKAGGYPSPQPSRIYPLMIIYLPGQDYPPTWARLSI